MGPLIILSGPSGSGKSTVIKRLLMETQVPLRLSVSVTTRSPRSGESDGVDYHYWDRQRFQNEAAENGFMEWAEVHGNCYGTLKREVEPFRTQGIGMILDIDVKGGEQVRKKCPEAVSVFLRTSSMQILEERLRKRQTETEEAIQRRLQGAITELARAGEYDFQVINDDLNAAVSQLRVIIEALFEKKT